MKQTGPEQREQVWTCLVNPSSLQATQYVRACAVRACVCVVPSIVSPVVDSGSGPWKASLSRNTTNIWQYIYIFYDIHIFCIMSLLQINRIQSRCRYDLRALKRWGEKEQQRAKFVK